MEVDKNEKVFICPKDKRKDLGIDKSSYTACDITPKSFKKEDMKSGYLSENILYIESDATHPGHKREEIKWESENAITPRHEDRKVTVVSRMDGHVFIDNLYETYMTVPHLK